MEGIEKLEKELQEMDDYNVTAIFDYLKTREDLYEYFKNEEKSLKQMYEYICDKARLQMKNNVAMIDNNVVYLWAVNYYLKSNEELGLKEKKVMPPTVEEVIEKINRKNDAKKDEKKDTTQLNLFKDGDN